MPWTKGVWTYIKSFRHDNQNMYINLIFGIIDLINLACDMDKACLAMFPHIGKNSEAVLQQEIRGL